MYYVYLIVTKSKNKFISYVGYTSDIKKRIRLHNSSKGAKFTRGRCWKLVYYKRFNSKILALKEEYKLKNNYKLRLKIKKNYIADENINFTSI